MRAGLRTAAMAALAGLLAVSCVDESDTAHSETTAEQQTAPAPIGPAAAATTIAVTLTEWTVTLDRESVPAGVISFEIHNGGTEDHAFEIEGGSQEWKTEPVRPGESATLSAPLTAGTYNVYCPLASGGEGHADRGMKTTFTVL